MGHRHLSTTMRYVHHQPRHEAAERLGRHFTGAAGELDALLGDPRAPPGRLRRDRPVDDSTRRNRPRKTRVRGNSGVNLPIRSGFIDAKRPAFAGLL